jgi:hypothetical protein
LTTNFVKIRQHIAALGAFATLVGLDVGQDRILAEVIAMIAGT